MDEDAGRRRGAQRPYAWQEQCLALWRENGRRGIVSAATGAGKTFLALSAVRVLREDPDAVAPLSVKIVVPKIFLALQWKKAILDHLEVSAREVGLFYGGEKCDARLPFVAYVIDSARYNLARHILEDIREGRNVFLICDEVHRFGSQSAARVFDYAPHAPDGRVFTLGLSATPDTEHLQSVIVPAIGDVFFRYDIEASIRDRVASPYLLFRIAVSLEDAERNEYEYLTERIQFTYVRLRAACARASRKRVSWKSAGFASQLNALIREGGAAGELAQRLKILYFKRKAVVYLAKSRIECGVALARLIHTGRKILIFAERIKTANTLYDALSAEYPGKVARYHSHMKPVAKQNALATYRSGRTPILLCCRALDEGLDVPETDVGIILSSGSGLRQRIQRIGRIVRKFPGGGPKRIYYLYIPDTSENPDVLLRDQMGGAGLGGEGQGETTRRGDSRSRRSDIFDLRFDQETQSFARPEYDDAMKVALETLAQGGASEKQMQNARFQFQKYAVLESEAPDEQVCVARLKTARGAERAYWSAAALLARARQCERVRQSRNIDRRSL